MRHFAVVGSGPSGFYTAEALARAYGQSATIDIIDRYPVPYGLVRFGVAPDHQSLKAVARRYDKVAEEDGVRFVGNVSVGTDVAVAELLELYDSVVLAIGAPDDRSLGIDGEDLPGVFGSAAFVGWYNGHPEYARLDPPLSGTNAAIIGNGNVALDVARILAKTAAELESSDIVAHARAALEQATISRITLVGRRGPHQIAMTPKELAELGHLEAAAPEVDAGDFPPVADDDLLDPGQRKSVTILRGFAAADGGSAKPKRIMFDFFAMPLRIEGAGRAERLIVERTALDADGRALGTGETYAIEADLIVTCIGYRTPPLGGVLYDERGGRCANEGGLVAERLYCVGWARRGPTGTIGTNRPDGYEVAERIAGQFEPGSSGGRAGHDGLAALLATRGIEPTDFDDWRRIEEAEARAARHGAPREKMVRIEDWLAVLGR